MDIIFFSTTGELRAWLVENHASVQEIQLGLMKRPKGKQVETAPGITYEEALNEALCFGWIDGVTHSIDETRWTIRFTPRRKTSKWSLSNIKRVEELIAQGRMTPAGLAAYEGHEERLNILYENVLELDESLQKRFEQASPAGWEFFQAQPPSYRRLASRWVMDAKREETRLKRLAELVEISGQGKRRVFM